MSQKIIYREDSSVLFLEGAREILEAIAFLDEASEPHITIGLPGGRSIVGLLDALVQERDVIDSGIWSKFHFFIIDERLVPLTHVDSNFRLINKHFFSKIISLGLLRETQIHPFCLDEDVSDFGVSKYEVELCQYKDRCDVSFLGVGEDGHVGALFPNHHSIENEADFYLTLADSPKPPPQRMTSGRNLLSRSRISVPLFIGEAKREALSQYLDPSLGLEQCPAKLANQAAQTILLTDLKTA